MASSMKPIKVFGKGGPNPPKVIFMLEELGLPHEIDDIPISDVKSPEYVKVNPNGRLPAIYDPNTDLTLWESGAIVSYLADKYDKDNKLSFPHDSNDAYLANQWLIYQVSGQGPYYGQALVFARYHSEKVPSALERYAKEINRVTAVVEGHLSKQGKGADGSGPWLVGGKFSYADLAWIPWQLFAPFAAESEYNKADYPLVKDWLRRMTEREPIKRTIEDNENLNKAAQAYFQ